MRKEKRKDSENSLTYLTRVKFFYHAPSIWVSQIGFL